MIMEKVVLFYKKDAKIAPAAKIIASVLKKKCKVTLLESHAKLKGKYDLMVAVGGDGTILRGARAAAPYGIPILGVNLGKIGFLSEIRPKEISSAISRILSGSYRFDERMMLKAEIFRRNKRIARTVALNDIVISKSGIARLIKFSVFVDGELMRQHNADGIIISTPTGSTAYNVSVGGPIVYPIYPMFIISAICPHSMSDRPLVIPARRDLELVEVKVKILQTPGEGGEVILTADGQEAIHLKADDEIVFKEAPNKTKFIRLRKYDFFRVLREKLNWN
jgi:NAD+ kinase